MSGTSMGIATLIVAGVTNAGFTMPMKYTRKWAWESGWLVWTILALVVLPLTVTLITIPNGPAASEMGAWGPILGWPLFMSLIVITATMLGVLTGEWMGCGPLPIRIQWTGLTLLVQAISTLAGSRRYLQ